jgi:hypothetical protein
MNKDASFPTPRLRRMVAKLRNLSAQQEPWHMRLPFGFTVVGRGYVESIVRFYRGRPVVFYGLGRGSWAFGLIRLGK